MTSTFKVAREREGGGIMVRFPHPNLISEQTPIVMLFETKNVSDF